MPARTRESDGGRSKAVRGALLTPSRRQLSKWEREQRARRLMALAAAALATIVLALLVAGYVQEVVVPAQETVAIAYGESISARDLLEGTRPAYQSLTRQVELLRERGLGQQAAQLQLQAVALPSQVLRAEIDRRVIAREVRARQLSVSDVEVQAEIRRRIEGEARFPQPTASPAVVGPEAAPTLGPPELASAYLQFLERIGAEDRQYREQVRESLLRDKLRDAVGAQVPGSAEQVRARHILVAEESKARDLLQRLKEGAAFAELAKAESIDAASTDKGGDLGWFPRGIMNEAFEQAAFASEPRSGPQLVSSPSGHHIVEVLERSAGRPLEPQDLAALRERHFQEWLTQARQGPEVRVQLLPATSEWVVRRLHGRIL